SVGFGPAGNRLIVAAEKQARLYGLDGRLHEFFPHDGAVLAVVFDGKRVFTAAADKAARLWSPALGWQGRHEGGAAPAVYRPKGDRVVSGGADKAVRVWNAADGKPVKEITAHEGAITGVGISLDGTKIISSGADKAVKFWAIPGGKEKED